MKKIYGIISVIIMLTFLCGCNNTEREVVGSDSVGSRNVSSKVLEAEKYENLININGSDITFPISLQELLETGAKINNERTKLTSDYLIDADDESTCYMIVDDTEFTVRYVNETSERVKFKECIITGIEEVEGNDITFPKGIKVGTDIETLEKEWGKADTESPDFLEPTIRFFYVENPIEYDYDDPLISTSGKEYIVTVSRENSKVLKINSYCDYYTEEITIENEFTTENDVIDIFKYTLPKDSSKSRMGIEDYYYIFTANDIKYYVKFNGISYQCNKVYTDEITEEYLRQEIEDSLFYDKNNNDLDIISNKSGSYTSLEYGIYDDMIKCTITYYDFYSHMIHFELHTFDNKKMDKEDINNFKEVAIKIAKTMEVIENDKL